MKSKRVRFIVTYSRKNRRWDIKLSGNPFVLDFAFLKHQAVTEAVRRASESWDRYGRPAEVVIKGMDGKIKDNRTYGRDPRRIKG